MADSRLLVSSYVSEDRSDERNTARACNIAKYIIDNFGSNAGKRINIKDLRKNIPGDVKDTSLNPIGDLKAHGNAVNVLNLGKLTRGKDTYVDFSLPNLKRCTSWILGQGRKVGAIQLIRDSDEPADENGEVPPGDNELIDCAIAMPQGKLTDWERNFVRSLDKKWRNGLTRKQRATLEKIIACS